MTKSEKLIILQRFQHFFQSCASSNVEVGQQVLESFSVQSSIMCHLHETVKFSNTEFELVKEIRQTEEGRRRAFL